MTDNARLYYFSGIFGTFHVVQMLLGSYQLFFKFNQSLVQQIACIAKTFRRQGCFCSNLCLVLVTK